MSEEMKGSAQSQPCGEASADAEVFAGLGAEPAAALAKRQLEHVARAIWFSEWGEDFPQPGTITHALAMQMAVAATEALAQAMEMER